MRIGVNAWFWAQPFTTKDQWVCKRVAELGFNHIEISIESTAQDLDYIALSQTIKDNGLTVSACAFFDESCDFCLEEAAKAQNAMKYMRYVADALQTLGGTVASGPFFSSIQRFWHPKDRKADLARAANYLKQMGDYAADRGIIFGIECINRYETSLINTAEQGMELVEMVDHPNVGLHLDSFHMGIEEKDLGKAIERAGKKLVHFHANENDRGVPGSGHTDWKGIAAAVKTTGYDRGMVIESFNHNLEQFAGIAKLWRPIVPKDSDLAGGASFLKNLFT
jgi:D-psicose/D-tagatose/L-ribulose 3-epimerase